MAKVGLVEILLPPRLLAFALGVRLDKVQRGILGDVTPVGDGVFELREFFGPGWRMYYVQHGAMLIASCWAAATSPAKPAILQRPKNSLPASFSRSNP